MTMPIRAKQLAALAAAGLGGSLLAFVPTAAHAAPPAGADVAGVATANGVPVADIEVDIYDSLPGGGSDYLGYAMTDASGEYWFDFDTNTASGGGYTDPSVQPQVKLGFYDSRTLTGDQLGLASEFYNDQPTLNRATPISKAAPGITTVVPTVSLAYQSGIKGTVSVPVPAGYQYYGYVEAYDVDENYVGSAGFDNDPGTTGRGRELTYLLDYLDPDQSYTLSAYAYAYSASGPDLSYISKFYLDGRTFAEATPVAVGARNAITQPVNWALSNTLSAKDAPSIEGQAAPGKTLTVDPGTWNLNAGNVYTYQWLLNDVQVSTAATYAPSKSDLKKKLRVLVTARNDDYAGTASTEPVKVGYASKLKTKATRAVVQGKTVVQVVGKLKVKGVKKNKAAKALKGKITVYEGDVRVGQGKVMKGGRILVTLKGITAGKHELVVEFAGKLAADATSTEKVRV